MRRASYWLQVRAGWALALTLVAVAIITAGLWVLLARQAPGSVLPVDPALSLFGALLAGESIVLAFVFGASFGWPSLSVVDRETRFSLWLVLGVAGGLAAIIGSAAGFRQLELAGFSLLIASIVLAIGSFSLLLRLATRRGCEAMLSGVLAAEFVHQSSTQDCFVTSTELTRFGRAVGRYFEALSAAVLEGDSMAVAARLREVSGALEELTARSRFGEGEAAPTVLAGRVALRALERVGHGVTSGAVDPLTMSDGATRLVPCMSRMARKGYGQSLLGQLAYVLADASNGALSAYKNETISQAKAARAISLYTQVRQSILWRYDAADQIKAPDEIPAVGWIAFARLFAAAHGSGQAALAYGLYQAFHPTKSKFAGDYWHGALVLRELTDALPVVADEAASHDKQFSQGEWRLISLAVAVGQLSTMRLRKPGEEGRTVPSEVSQADFNDHRKLLVAYVNTYAGVGLRDEQCADVLARLTANDLPRPFMDAVELTNAEWALEQLEQPPLPFERPIQSLVTLCLAVHLDTDHSPSLLPTLRRRAVSAASAFVRSLSDATPHVGLRDVLDQVVAGLSSPGDHSVDDVRGSATVINFLRHEEVVSDHGCIAAHARAFSGAPVRLCVPHNYERYVDQEAVERQWRFARAASALSQLLVVDRILDLPLTAQDDQNWSTLVSTELSVEPNVFDLRVNDWTS